MDLKKTLISLKNDPSAKHASDVLFNLTSNDDYYDKVRDYHGGEYAPLCLAADELESLINDELSNDGTLMEAEGDEACLDEVTKYADADWIDLDTFKPVTADDVRNIIKHAIMA